MAKMHYLTPRKPPSLPSAPPFGPQPAPQQFERAQAQLDAAFVRAWRGDDATVTSKLFSEAYASWAGLAEWELARTLG
eukprot:9181352-Pyramimonas_sp.AAC.1